MAKVSQGDLTLYYTLSKQLAGREVAMVAMMQKGKALYYALAKLKLYRTLVMAAMRQSGGRLSLPWTSCGGHGVSDGRRGGNWLGTLVYLG